jgi:hypothetical protein
LLIGFSIASGIAQSASADQGFNLEDVAYEYEFGKTLIITATISRPYNIKNLTVSLEPENLQARQILAEIDNNTQIKATYDLQTNSIDPFSRVYFWFNAELQNGSIISSPSFWFDYIDNRLEWKSNTSKLFQIFWVNGDSKYGQNIQLVAKNGLEQATMILPLAPSIPIEIYIYPDIASLNSIFSTDSELWVNGRALLKANRIIVVDEPPLEDITDLERSIPHEIMHLLQFQVLGANYAYAPTWLMEGLASQAELYANSDRERVLAKAIETRSLTPLNALCLGISPDPEQANIDYAHSASLVHYIQNTYGNQVFLTLLEGASSGKDCNSLVNASLGISLQRLEDEWLASVSDNPPTTTLRQLTPYLWIFIPGVLAISGIVVLIIRRSRTNRKESNWNKNA